MSANSQAQNAAIDRLLDSANKGNTAVLMHLTKETIPGSEVRLTYFRFDDERQGKFYSEGSYFTRYNNMPDVVSEVSDMLDNERLPGIRGHSWAVHIEVQGTMWAYPHVLFPRQEGTLLTRLWLFEAVARNFIAKVDSGKARSVNTYNALKSLLPKSEV